MTKSSTINIMISSPNKTKLDTSLLASEFALDGNRNWVSKKSPKDKVEISGDTLSDLRKSISDFLELQTRSGLKQFISVWINENAPSEPLSRSWVQECIQQIQKSHIVIILYTGESGSPIQGESPTGICLAEAEEAVRLMPDSTLLIDVTGLVDGAKPDSAMTGFKVKHQGFSVPIKSFSKLFEHIEASLNKKIIEMAITGAMYGRSALTISRGKGLTWSRMTQQERQKAMTDAMFNEVGNKSVGKSPMSPSTLNESTRKLTSISLKGIEYKLILSAVPGPMSDAAAKAAWGRPDLDEISCKWPKGMTAIGPVHFVSVRGGVTENQAMKLINNPDAFVISTDFGVWASDRVQGIQIAFLADCTDEIRTQRRFSDAVDWLIRADEIQNVQRRAEKRSQLLALLSKV